MEFHTLLDRKLGTLHEFRHLLCWAQTASHLPEAARRFEFHHQSCRARQPTGSIGRAGVQYGGRTARCVTLCVNLVRRTAVHLRVPVSASTVRPVYIFEFSHRLVTLW